MIVYFLQASEFLIDSFTTRLHLQVYYQMVEFCNYQKTEQMHHAIVYLCIYRPLKHMT